MYFNSTLSSSGLECLLSEDLKVRDFPAVSTEKLLLVSSSFFPGPGSLASPLISFEVKRTLVFRAKYKLCGSGWRPPQLWCGKYTCEGAKEGRCEGMPRSQRSVVPSGGQGIGQEVGNIRSAWSWTLCVMLYT